MKIQIFPYLWENVKENGPPDLPSQNIGTPAAGCVKDIIYVKYYSVCSLFCTPRVRFVI